LILCGCSRARLRGLHRLQGEEEGHHQGGEEVDHRLEEGEDRPSEEEVGHHQGEEEVRRLKKTHAHY